VRRRSNRLQVSDMSEEDPFGFGADDSEGNADPFQSEDLHVQGGFDAFGGEDENSVSVQFCLWGDRGLTVVCASV